MSLIKKVLNRNNSHFIIYNNAFRPTPSKVNLFLRSCSTASPPVPPKPKGFLSNVFGVESNVANENFKARWLMVVPAFATHMCIGSPYAWSLMGDGITRELGFVASAAGDWTLMEAAFPLSIVFLMQGLGAAIAGSWQQKVGARTSMAIGSCLFGGGLAIGALGIHLHSLPLLYGGYGFIAGTGLGLTYTPPLQTLISWFPDKKGIASGLCIAGFGSGALVFAPIVSRLMKNFAKLPEYLGPVSDFATSSIDGRLYVNIDGKLIEVVEAGVKELAKLPYQLSEGLYIVGSGSTGAAEALAVMGAGYFTIMLLSALAIKRPHPSYIPAGMPAAPTAAAAVSKALPAVVPDITANEAIMKPQFHLLGITLGCISIGGFGLFSVAKPMMSEVFSSALPTVVTAAYASSFVMMLSAANLGGRLGWAAVSDVVGRRTVFNIFTLGSVPMYLAMPSLVNSVMETGSAVPLYAFVGCAVGAITILGGTFAVIPAYEADLFGSKNVGAIHGRLLLYMSCASLSGPMLLLNLRGFSERQAILDLVGKIQPDKFLSYFGTPIEKAADLIATKTLTINKLLVLAPPGTLDPTPHLYDTTMYTMGALMAVAAVTHSLVRPLPVIPAAPRVIDVKHTTEDVKDFQKEKK